MQFRKSQQANKKPELERMTSTGEVKPSENRASVVTYLLFSGAKLLEKVCTCKLKATSLVSTLFNHHMLLDKTSYLQVKLLKHRQEQRCRPKEFLGLATTMHSHQSHVWNHFTACNAFKAESRSVLFLIGAELRKIGPLALSPVDFNLRSR